MISYSAIAVNQIYEAYTEIGLKANSLKIKIYNFSNQMNNEKAIEFIMQGVNRRLYLLNKCIDNIFILFPPDEERKVPKDDIDNININLHAFIINIFGIIENISLSIAYENNIYDKIDYRNINLYNKKFQNMINKNLSKYLSEEKCKNWYKNYIKNYRDALAHRIAPYVPPASLTKEDRIKIDILNKEIEKYKKMEKYEKVSELFDEIGEIGSADPIFMHSFSEESRPIYLHPQLIDDFLTVEELLHNVLDDFYI